mgnify:CR=1 FL=1
MAQTLISKADALIRENGKEEAINFFQKRIDAIGSPKSFQDIINLTANKNTIDYINGKYNNNEEK